MAALAADINVVFDPRYDIGLTQFAPTAADIYYRGGLAHKVAANSLATLTPADADSYLGVVMEHAIVTTSSLVWLATTGKFWFTGVATFTNANVNGIFAIQATDLFDNPATLDVQGAGDAGACGKLVTVDATTVSGWLNTNVRAADVNA